MQIKKFVITMKLEKKDADINLLFKHCNAKKTIINVIKAYINGGHISLPLPPFKDNVPLKQYYRYTYPIKGNEDVVEWLKIIKKGYKNHAIKMLIRHAMEEPDIRHCIIKNRAPEIRGDLKAFDRHERPKAKPNLVASKVTRPTKDTEPTFKSKGELPALSPVKEEIKLSRDINEQRRQILDMLK